LLSALLAWLLAWRLASPLLRLSNVADQLRRGEPAVIPHVGGYAEAEILSNSLRTLVDELKHREQRLSELNVSLEHQVADRTRKLEKRNLQLAAAKEKAELATQSKSRFLAAASHDLRQPLHALTLFARALSRRVEGEEAKGLVAQTEQALASLKEMFDALLNVSRLDAGLIQPNLQTVALADIVDRVSAGFRAEAEHRGLSFRSRAIEAAVRTDPALLETMLRNLLSNALKFTKKGGVMLACRRVDGRISIDVVDTGPGIGPELQARVFQEFHRSQFTATGANDGLGLGLSIVQRYAQLLGMTVEFNTRQGRGTRFTLKIPDKLVEEISAEPARPPGAAPCRLKNHRILVLDDEPLIVESLARDLTDRGNTVLRAGSPAEAEQKMAMLGYPDVAVVDIDLTGDESGPDFIARMEAQFGKQLPTLILTGATDAETLAGLISSGRPWLTKPADPDAISSVLAGLAAGGGPQARLARSLSRDEVESALAS
jgi:signal transduction histidine kinase/ActR/RegA family two-component response regulator